MFRDAWRKSLFDYFERLIMNGTQLIRVCLGVIAINVYSVKNE